MSRKIRTTTGILETVVRRKIRGRRSDPLVQVNLKIPRSLLFLLRAKYPPPPSQRRASIQYGAQSEVVRTLLKAWLEKPEEFPSWLNEKLDKLFGAR